MLLISFNTFSFNLFFLIGTPIFGTASFLIRYYSFDEKVTKHHPLYLTLSMFIGQFMSSVFDCIIIFTSKSTVNSKNLQLIPRTKRHKYSLILNKDIPQSRLCSISNMILFALCALFDLVSTVGIFITSVYVTSVNREYETKVFLILSTGALSHIFFNYPIYKHQLVGIVFIIIGEVIAYCFDKPYDYIDFIYLLWYSILAFMYIVSKWLMEEQYVNPFRLLGFKGLFGIIMICIAIALAENIKCNWDFCQGTYIESFSYLITICTHKVLFLNYFIFAIICFVLNIGFEMINKIFNPNHLAVSGTFASILQVVIVSLIKPRQFEMESLIGNSLILIGCIFYNELIIFHFCDLAYNTKKEIEKRSKEESSSANRSIHLTDINDSDSIYSSNKSSQNNSKHRVIVV